MKNKLKNKFLIRAVGNISFIKVKTWRMLGPWLTIRQIDIQKAQWKCLEGGEAERVGLRQLAEWAS